MERIYGSFRDPNGEVYKDGDAIIRTIRPSYSTHWSACVSFLAEAADEGVIPSFEELPEAPEGVWKALRVRRVPFISYPYEWCFSQLKDAALLSLALQRRALSNGLIMKDASAYNVQFHNGRPMFIDLLSFEKHTEGHPWAAYRQFCSHFLAPLALAVFNDLRCLGFSRQWIDGIPLDLAASLLSPRARLKPSLLWHVFLHARMQVRHADTRTSASKARNARVSTATLDGLAAALEHAVQSLSLPARHTEWSDYYADTNYTDDAARHKLEMVEQAVRTQQGALAVDMGANTGRYTRLLAPHFAVVLATDIDPLAVERHYLHLKGQKRTNILPLVLDLANPSPGLGFAGRERDSFNGRCRADFMLALALVHHLAITGGIPLARLAEYFAGLLKPGAVLVLEFVPKEDSQTQRLLAVRPDTFAEYHLEGCRSTFAEFFEETACLPIRGSLRTLLILQKRA